MRCEGPGKKNESWEKLIHKINPACGEKNKYFHLFGSQTQAQMLIESRTLFLLYLKSCRIWFFVLFPSTGDLSENMDKMAD